MLTCNLYSADNTYIKKKTPAVQQKYSRSYFVLFEHSRLFIRRPLDFVKYIVDRVHEKSRALFYRNYRFAKNIVFYTPSLVTKRTFDRFFLVGVKNHRSGGATKLCSSPSSGIQQKDCRTTRRSLPTDTSYVGIPTWRDRFSLGGLNIRTYANILKL